jgi:hypothetical protein
MQRGGREHFKVAAAQFGVGVFGGDDLALLGQAKAALYGPAGLGQNGVVTRPATTPDRAAAAME